MMRPVAPFLSLCLLLTSAVTLAEQPASSAPAAAIELPLSALPKPPARTPEPPSTVDLALLDEVLAGLTSADPARRDTALQALDEVQPALIPAAAERLRRLGESADKQALKSLMTQLRADAKEQESEDDSGSDNLLLVLRRPQPEKPTWRELTHVLGLSRIFTALGSVEGARQLINVYVRFGEFLRVDTQKQLAKMELGSAAALIEASRHPAAKIAKWARRELAKRKLDQPSKLLQRAEGNELADILRAYGFTRDPDLARSLISFASSSQLSIRQAAREGIATMGEVAHWPLRDAYETTSGRRPPREWAWDRCARELFREMDQNRLHDVLLAYQAGLAAQQRGDLEQMREQFDVVLTRAPGFEEAAALAQGYFDYANSKLDSNAQDAAQALRRAERLANEGPLKLQIQSLLMTLQGEQLLQRGVADQILFRRALELDGSNSRARDLLQRVTRVGSEAPAPLRRYATAIAIAVLGALGTLLLLRRPRSEPDPHAANAVEPTKEQGPSADEPQPGPERPDEGSSRG